jgi:hypothetical protein
MTTLLDEELSAPAEPAGRSRRFKLLAAMTIVAILGACIAVGLALHNRTPRPDIRPGFFGSAEQGAARTVGPPDQDPAEVVLTGPVGSKGGVLLSLSNWSKRPVELIGPAGASAGLSIRWARAQPSGDLINYRVQYRTARDFPMTMQPGQQIGVYVMATKPQCTKPSFFGYDALTLRTSIGGHQSLWTEPFEQGALSEPAIVPCPTKSDLRKALRHR